MSDAYRVVNGDLYLGDGYAGKLPEDPLRRDNVLRLLNRAFAAGAASRDARVRDLEDALVQVIQAFHYFTPTCGGKELGEAINSARALLEASEP